MDHAQSLVRMVTRAFYETRQIIVVDAIITHSALRDNDLSYIVSMNIKDLHKLVAKLKEERIVFQYNRPELREGQTRPVTQIYYFIDYRQAIDAIKWRLYNVTKDIQGNEIPASEKKEYFCRQCGAEYTNLEVLDTWDDRGFLCQACTFPLDHDLERNATGHEQSTRLNNQFQFITDLLQQIDSSRIPETKFEQALNNIRHVVRDAAHPMPLTVPAAASGFHRPTAVKGLTNMGPTSLDVSISVTDGPSEAELQSERERKERIAQNNALPEWISTSTVTGESFEGSTTRETAAAAARRKEEQKAHDEKRKASMLDEKENADIDDYFSRLKAEQEAEKLKEMQEEEDSGDEEDDDDADFEDAFIPVTMSTSAATSSATTPTPSAMKLPTSNHTSDSTASSPVAKRVRLEVPPGQSQGETGNGTRLDIGQPDSGNGNGVVKKEEEEEEEEEESEEDIEFEDV